MKFQHTLLLGLATTLPFAGSLRAAESVKDALRRGLLAEETTRDLKAAAEAYAEAVRLSSDQRVIEATALFRLAECQKKLGSSTEATATLQRLAREYPEQRELLAKIPASLESKRSPQGIDMAVLPRLRAQLDASVSAYNEKVEEVARLKGWSEQLRPYSGAAFAARVPAEYSNPELPRLIAEINQATVRKASLNPDFGPNHPEVRRQDLTIKELNQLMSEQKEAILERIQADLNRQHGKLDQLMESAKRLREAMDQEEAKLASQASDGRTVALPPADSSQFASTQSSIQAQSTSLSESDLRSQIDSLSAELEVLQKLPDAVERGRFIVSRHPELAGDGFRGEVAMRSATLKSPRTNEIWRHFESMVQSSIRPIEDRLRFARMELEVLQKRSAERAPWSLIMMGELSRPGTLEVKRGQKLTVSQAVQMSGGPTAYADLKKVIVRRKTTDGKDEKISVNVDRVLNQGDTDADLILLEGDTVIAPRRTF